MKKDKRIVVWLNWPEACFCVKARDIAFLRTLVLAKVIVVRSEFSFLRNLPKATGVICWEFRKEWFAHAPKLRILATPGAGRELLPKDDELPPGVRRINGEFHGRFMSETVIACIFAHARGLYAAKQFQDIADHAANPTAAVLWPRTAMSPYCFSVAGTKAVILGYGRIGQTVGQKLSALGVSVIGIRRRNFSTFIPALREADWLIVCLPSDTGTDGILNASVFRAMKRRAVLINVGRGNCVDEMALATALSTHRIAGAYLDVFAHEPLDVSSPLAHPLPGLVRLPHCSAFAPEYLQTFFAECAEVFNRA